MLKTFFKVTLTLLLFSGLSNAQTNSGITEDNFNGTHGILTNPSNVADSRVKFELNLISLSFLLGNDYSPLTLSNVKSIINGEDYMGFATSSNNGLVNLDILFPSLMMNINKRSSFGITSRLRVLADVNNINGDFAKSIISGFPDESYDFDFNKMDVTAHGWAEFGLTYGRIFYSHDDHFIKGGISLKYLLGGGVVQMTSNSFSGDYDISVDAITLNGDYSYGLIDENKFGSGTGFGTDIGFVYEFRPESASYAKEDAQNRGKNKYKLKLGLSVLDIGAITYKDFEQNEYNITNGTLSREEAENDFSQALEDNFNPITKVINTKVFLPTSLQINADYRMSRFFYTSLNYNQNLNGKDKPYSNNGLNLLTLAPRFETKYFSLHLPFGYSQLGQTSFGAGLRMGPLTLGSSTILSNVLSKKANLANVYFGLKIPVYQENKITEIKNKEKKQQSKDNKKQIKGA